MKQHVSPSGKRFYASVLKVADIRRVRFFFREIVGLGEPIVDSNFWVEFDLGQGVILVLEQHDAAATRAAAGPGNVAWCFEVDDLDSFANHLAEFGVPIYTYDPHAIAGAAATFLDPEGNPFMVLQRRVDADASR